MVRVVKQECGTTDAVPGDAERTIRDQNREESRIPVPCVMMWL